MGKDTDAAQGPSHDNKRITLFASPGKLLAACLIAIAAIDWGINRLRARRSVAAPPTKRNWCDYEFSLVDDIRPERDADGKVIQMTYTEVEGQRLSKYADGPFCRFTIPGASEESGVYVITLDGNPKYVGLTKNLSQRYNNGYGYISSGARNMRGGQSTNCRINNKIYSEVIKGKTPQLWFHATTEYEDVEAEMILEMQPEWNIKGIKQGAI